MAWSDGNYEANISSVAAAIFDATDSPIAALNVSGQPSSFDGAARRRQIAAAVRSASYEISQRLGWHGPQTSARAAGREKEENFARGKSRAAV
jgi:DNA-binding IclR family transcriptional regulator